MRNISYNLSVYLSDELNEELTKDIGKLSNFEDGTAMFRLRTVIRGSLTKNIGTSLRINIWRRL